MPKTLTLGAVLIAARACSTTPEIAQPEANFCGRSGMYSVTFEASEVGQCAVPQGGLVALRDPSKIADGCTLVLSEPGDGCSEVNHYECRDVTHAGTVIVAITEFLGPTDGGWFGTVAVDSSYLGGEQICALTYEETAKRVQ